MKEYFGVIEIESAPYRACVKFLASDVEKAKKKYEEHCDAIGGYVLQLYPVTQEIIDKFGLAYENAKEI